MLPLVWINNFLNLMCQPVLATRTNELFFRVNSLHLLVIREKVWGESINSQLFTFCSLFFHQQTLANEGSQRTLAISPWSVAPELKQSVPAIGASGTEWSHTRAIARLMGIRHTPQNLVDWLRVTINSIEELLKLEIQSLRTWMLLRFAESVHMIILEDHSMIILKANSCIFKKSRNFV